VRESSELGSLADPERKDRSHGESGLCVLNESFRTDTIQGTLFIMMLIIIGFVVLAALVGIGVAFIDWKGEKKGDDQ